MLYSAKQPEIGGRTMKWGYLVLILLISALLVPALGCQSGYEAIELVPANSNLIAGIQISKIINDQDMIDAYDEMLKEPDQPQTFSEALDELFNESGIDINDFSRVLIFGDISNIEQSEYVGFIAEGTFDENDFIKNVEENMGEKFSTIDYKGYKLYSSDDEDFSFAFLNDKILLGGSTRAVKDSVDVSKGDSKPVAGQLLDTYNRYGNALISLVIMIPENARDTFADESMMSDMPISMDAFSSIDIIGFSLDKEKATLNSRIELHSLGVDLIQDAYDIISGTINMLIGMMEEPGLKELLENMEVSLSESWIIITFKIELSQIEELMETYGE
jgi:hypothetical protein